MRMQLQMIRLPYGPELNSEATGNVVMGLTLQAFSLEVFVSGWSPLNRREPPRKEMKLKSLGWQCNKESLQSGMTSLDWLCKVKLTRFLAFAFHLPKTLAIDLKFDFS